MMRHLRSPILASYLATLMGLAPMSALANPQGGQVAGGQATIAGQGTAHVTVNQGSQRAIINWNTFNIGAGEKTQFVQPGIDAVALNRVTGPAAPSTILGTIEANGRVFLVNRDGILFGSSAVINTSGFLATTHDITNADFMAGKTNFTIPGNPSASIVNLGTITANNSGIAALVAPGVRNSGTITAELGKVALASNNGFTLDFYGDKLITMQVDGVIANQVKDVQTGQTLDALVKNEGPNAKLSANGGRVELTAAAARHVVDSVINNSGVIEANSVGTRNGKIVLGAATASTKGAVADVQKVKVSGTLTAAGKKAGEKGGKIVVTGENIALAGATLDASGKSGGGTVLVGGDVGGGKGNAAVAGLAQAALEGEAVATATTVTVDAGTMIDVSATERGNGGKAVVWSDQFTGFAGAIRGLGGVQGGDGGFAEVSSKGQLAYTGLADLRASAGAFGTLLLDPRNLTISDGAGSGTTTTGGPSQTSFTATVDDSVINKNTLLAALAAANVVVSTGSTGNQAGNITVATQLAWSQATTLTLAAASNITINAAITATHVNGGLTLNAGGSITTGVNGAVNVGIFTLQKGAWSQVGPSNPAFTARDFRIVAGSFLRALGGSGTTADPYQIADVYGLQGVGSTALLDKRFWLNNDIDASGTKNWNGGAGFKSIGNSSNRFTGVFDGRGFEISGLTIHSTSQYVGLFGYLGRNAVVRDVGLIGVDVQSTYSDRWSAASVGALAGYNDGGSISGAYATGVVRGASDRIGSNIGGLVGSNAGDIERSYASVSVSATGRGTAPWVGGLVGKNTGSVWQSYADGSVDGSQATGSSGLFGGLVGNNLLGSISQSYALGAVIGNSRGSSGGLVGSNSGSIDETYASGRVSGGGTQGGLVGRNYGLVSDSYWDKDTSGRTNAFGSNIMPSFLARATGLSTADARNQASYSGWNFGANGAWFMIPGYTRPFLRTEWSTTVRNAHQLQLMAMNLGAQYTLRNDIDLGTALAQAGGMWGTQGFAAIGGNGWEDFNGSFDGDGNEIKGLKMASNVADVGLFGVIGSDGRVSNVKLTNVTIAATGGSQNVGAIAGTNRGQIENASATGMVGNAIGMNSEGRIQGSYGGLVGRNEADGDIISSWADVAVTAYGPSNGFIDAGGLVGTNSGRISSSYAEGAVSGSSSSSDHIYVGGLVGLNDYGAIEDSYAIGAVTGAGYNGRAGGLVAVNDGGDVLDSYATGVVTMSGDYAHAGGLAGENKNGGSISDAYATGRVIAATSGSVAGGLVGYNDNATIERSRASGDVNVGAGGMAGGLVGENSGTITGDSAMVVGSNVAPPSCAAGQTCASGTVTVGRNGIAGGLVGFNEGDIAYAFATGLVRGAAGSAATGDGSGATTLGGLVGVNFGTSKNVLAFGDVSGLVGVNGAVAGGIVAGGLVGDNAGWIENAFAYGAVTAGNRSVVGGLVGSQLPPSVGCDGDCASVQGASLQSGPATGVFNAAARGNVTAGDDSYVGGAVGYVAGLEGTASSFNLVNAYGNVSAGARSNVGGLGGKVDGYASLALVAAYGNVAAGSHSNVGGLVGHNVGLISGATYWAPAGTGKGVYGTSDSAIGGLVGFNQGTISNFVVDPPVVGSGSGNSVGGAVGDNSGTVQDGTVIADVSGGGGSTVGPIAGSNSGTVSGTNFTGTVNGANPNTPPDDPPPPPPPADNPPPNEPAPITQAQFTPPSDPTTNNNFVLNQGPDSPGSTGGTGGGSGGQGGSAGGSGGSQGGGSGGGNSGAGNNPPPPQSGPPPGPGIGRTPSEQRYSGVPPITETRFLPGEVVVQVANTIPAERIQEIARQLGITLIASQAIDGSGRVVYRFSTGNGKNIRDVIRALERQQIVASAQPNYVFSLAQTAVQDAPVPGAGTPPSASPAPPAQSGGPAEVETGSLPPSPELSSDLQSDMASRTTGLPKGDAAQYIIDKLRLGVVHARSVGRNIPVAVIDSEIDVQHPDLVGVVSETFDATGTASNPHAHGTGMAGAIASHRRLLGIAPGVKILAIKAFDETNTSAEATSFQILKGLAWALTRKPRIINMSFAGPRDLMLERALQKAYEQGIVLIAAAGNAGPKSPPLYPAADVNVIAVSASDHADKPFAMANRGKHIAVAAPGVDVLVPSPKGGYQLTTGTSVAAAHVSGVAALLLESKPTLTPKEVRAILTGSARPIALRGVAEIFGAGLVDPFEALSRLGPRPVSAAPAASAVQ